ncbi:hypothetical protein PR048_001596 [Dryococelus australis]|uniref:Uncharacterized protein n=1 Tax=Dryococelus australis TaxID=614101 RepID=A0ABQ9IHT5_9NEOP|nr:hypothetical protein PR048_001596 [Dryococelus australis]
MNGYLRSTQIDVRKDHPFTLYAHCSAPTLKLAIEDSRSLPAIRNDIGTFQSVGSFFRISTKLPYFSKQPSKNSYLYLLKCISLAFQENLEANCAISTEDLRLRQQGSSTESSSAVFCNN